MPSRCSSTRRRRPSRICSRMSERVWAKNASRAPKPSSSKASGPTSASRSARCSLPSAVSGRPACRGATGRRRRASSGGLLGDPARLGQPSQRRIERTVGKRPERPEQGRQPLAELVAVHRALVEQAQNGDLQHRRVTPYSLRCITTIHHRVTCSRGRVVSSRARSARGRCRTESLAALARRRGRPGAVVARRLIGVSLPGGCVYRIRGAAKASSGMAKAATRSRACGRSSLRTAG